MIERRATLAIVRRNIDRRFALDWAIGFALVFAISAIFGRLLTPTLATLAASALAAALASERSHVQSMRRASLFAMPLYGRELARAQAVAPLVLAASIPLGWLAGAFARGAHPTPEIAATLLLAAAVSTLTAISSIYRDGARAWLYAAGGTLLGVAVCAPALAALRAGFAISFALAIIAGYFALRAFGETLARYDPIPDD